MTNGVVATALCRRTNASTTDLAPHGDRAPSLQQGKRWLLIALFLIVGAAASHAQSAYSVEIDLEEQTAHLLRGRQVVLSSPISTGRSGHLTQTGSFKIIEKERNHFS